MSGLYNLLELGKRDNYNTNLQICRTFKFKPSGTSLDVTVMTGPGCLPERETKVLNRGQVLGTSTIMQFFEEGPKYISMTPRQFEALENTDLTFPIREYTQPFPAICFPIPEGYAKDRAVEWASRSETPKYAVFCKREGLLLFTLVYSREFVWSVFIIPRHEDETFEEHFEGMVLGNSQRHRNFDMSFMKQLCRACINGSMIFDTVKTTNFSTKVSKGSKLKSSTYYSFHQSVQLFSREGDPGDGTGEGSEVKCHWRRGHWRQQRYGPQLSLQKRIRIAPVLVRRDKFDGELKDAQATYNHAGIVS